MAGTARRWKGGVTKTSRKRKNTDTVIRTAVTYGIRSRFLRRFWISTTLVIEVRISSQNSSDPFWPPQKAVIV